MSKDADFIARTGIQSPQVLVGNTIVTNTSVSVGNSTVNTAITGTNIRVAGTANVIGATSFANTVTGPGTTTNLDGFLIDCGTW